MRTAFLFEILVLIACAANAATAAADDFDIKYPSYRVEIMTPGGPLPFVMKTSAREYFLCGDPFLRKPIMIVFNGPERIESDYSSTSQVFGEHRDLLGRITRRTRATTSVRFDAYDSQIAWDKWLGPELGDTHFTYGTWTKRRGEDYVEVPIIVTPLDGPIGELDSQRFRQFPEGALPAYSEPADFSGRWSVDFASGDEPAIGVFEVDEDQIASGTFLTTTGDYRFLAGRVDGPYLRLSTFDGAHAFLFHARMQEDGSLKGDFWSGNWHHEEWTAVRDDNAALPDAFEQTTVADEDALEELVFRDTDGNPTRVHDALDATNAPARVLEIFGTWCPNCADAGRELVSLKAKYGHKLGVVGLAFEVTEDFQRSATQVRRHHEHIGSDWQVLIAGLSDKEKATQTLGFLDRVRSYPTLVFLDADNQVKAIYSGFSGPATGEAFEEQRRRFEALIEELIGNN